MSQLTLVKCSFKSGQEHLWLAWCEELTCRRDEVLETLKNEGVKLEACFLAEDEKSVYYFMQAENLDKAKQAAEASVKNNLFKIDVEHRRVRRESLGPAIELKKLFEFEI